MLLADVRLHEQRGGHDRYRGVPLALEVVLCVPAQQRVQRQSDAVLGEQRRVQPAQVAQAGVQRLVWLPALRAERAYGPADQPHLVDIWHTGQDSFTSKAYLGDFRLAFDSLQVEGHFLLTCKRIHFLKRFSKRVQW